MEDILLKLAKIVEERKNNPSEGSYTNYLFEKGLDKILKKIGEESAETIIAAKNGDKTEIANEVCDLLYHLLVMLNFCGVDINSVIAELELRAEKQNNLKELKNVDKNS